MKSQGPEENRLCKKKNLPILYANVDDGVS